MDITMLSDEEFKLCIEARELGKSFVDSEIDKRGIVDYNWLGDIPKSYERQRYFIDMYRVITGFDEDNPNVIWHHRINNFGPDCPDCGKPLRTHLAKYCASCGFGKQNLNKDSRPLVEKRPDLFK